MFKLKVSIYMKSGNVIYIRVGSIGCVRLSGSIENREIEWHKGNFRKMTIDVDEIECIIIKEWYQRWG